MQKVSIRFFHDTPVRAVWNDEKNNWFFSVPDAIGAIRGESVYEKNRNYWKYLKNRLKKENSQLVSAAIRLKLTAPDGKKRNTDVMDAESIRLLAAEFPARIAVGFVDWFVRSEDSIDGKSKQNDSNLLHGFPL